MRFNVILIDPPWKFETRSDKGQNRSAERHYPCMTLEDIYALPIKDVAAKDCLMLVWVTRPMLEHGFEFLRRQGFKYSTMIDWVKMKDGKLQQGTGYRARDTSEVMLIATRGSVPLQPPALRQPSSIVAPRTRHSEKPAAQYLYARGCFPDNAPMLEVFARRLRYSELPLSGVYPMREWRFIGGEISGIDVRVQLAQIEAEIERPIMPHDYISKDAVPYSIEGNLEL